MIVTAEDLSEYLPRLIAAPRIALDTEADSLHCYREKLCLVQLEVPGQTDGTLLDPLAGFSLTPFFDALRGRKLVLHGADYDLRLFKRTGEFVPSEIFDTMIAARLVGRREFSLAALVKSFFGIEMTKGSQKANWAKRPLTPQMMTYARNDTRYLFEIADRLTTELEAKGRVAWFQQSCQRLLDNVSMAEAEKSREESWRIAGSGTFRGRAAALLRELWWWRDAEAAAVDRPAFHILRNEELLSTAKSIDAGGRLPHWRHVRGARLQRLEESIERALNLPQSEWPSRVRVRSERPTADMDARANVLKQRRDTAATKLEIDPALIAPRAVIEGIAYRNDPPTQSLMPWQQELLGV
jgi:ribonuclease D